VVGHPEQGVLEIDQLALHVDRDDLAGAAGDDLVTDGEAGQQQARMSRPVALADDVMMLFHRLHGVRKREQGGAVGGVETAPIREPADHQFQRRGLCGRQGGTRHVRLPLFRAGAPCITRSQHLVRPIATG
jgi:hypothetical protein